MEIAMEVAAFTTTQVEGPQNPVTDLDTAATSFPTVSTTASTTLPTTSSATSSATMADNLVSAGIDNVTAEDIARRRNLSDLNRLELRDRAIREDYIDTDRYQQEMRELLSDQTSIREEVGDQYYDRYLYLTGRANRIGVASIMEGSAAQSAGVQSGDLIIQYDDQRMYNWNDLQLATTQGQRSESVNLTVQRAGSELMISIPRGPLGVRLNSVRLDPDEG